MEAAQRRLRALAESRDVTTGDPGAGGLVPAGVPAYIADLFSTSCRNAAALAGALPQPPLPESGMDVSTPRFTTGATVAVQAAQADAVSETDIDFESPPPSSPVATIAGQVDLSQQALDRSLPGLDVALSRELGEALGEAIDSQLIQGTGLNGQTLGLLNVTGATVVSYADATPTQPEAWAKLMDAYAQASQALGLPPDLLCMHPRRAAWFWNWKDTAGGLVSPRWPARLLEVPCIPLTLSAGGGTNEDVIFLLRSEELPVMVGGPRFRVMIDWTGSGSLTARVQALCYLAFLPNRKPEAVTSVEGSGLATPSYS